MVRSADEKRDKRLTVYLTEQEETRLDAVVKHMGTSKAKFMIRAMNREIHQLEDPPELLVQDKIGEIMESQEEPVSGYVCSNRHVYWIGQSQMQPPDRCPVCGARDTKRTWVGTVHRDIDCDYRKPGYGQKYWGCKMKDAKIMGSDLAQEGKQVAQDIQVGIAVEMAVVAAKETEMECYLLESNAPVTVHIECSKVVPGEILKITPIKVWQSNGHAHISGNIESARIDATALGLKPLHLYDTQEVWDPENIEWVQDMKLKRGSRESQDKWLKPVIAYGPRQMYTIENVIPGEKPGVLSNPLNDAEEWMDGGNYRKAYDILMKILESDLRCLDAHNDLAYLAFDKTPELALKHYEVGVRIGELSLNEGFNGVLWWYSLDNRPFLRCMHGYGLCLWRLKRLKESEDVFNRMLWLNPSDNQGVRYLMDDVKHGRAWKADR